MTGQKPVVVRKTEKLRERERKALFPSKGKGNDDDDLCELYYVACARLHLFY